MSAIQSTKAFYIQLTEVVNSLVNMFPDDADLLTLKTFLGMISKTNPSLIINKFYEGLTPEYEAYIDSKNEEFFTNYTPVEYGAEGADIFGKVQSYWTVFDDQTKESIWQYFYILKELCKRAYAKPT
jgi:hypothetical protein